MTFTFKSNATRHTLTLVPVAAALALAGPALAQTNDTSLSFDANVEIDTDVLGGKQRTTNYDMGGRLEFNLFGEHRVGDHFVRGRGTALLLKDGDTATDDMWGMVGSERWDVQIGRFEGFDLFPKGKDTILEHAGDVEVFEANGARGRADDGGQFAAHFHPTDALSFELGTIYAEGDKTKAFTGVRPAVFYAGSGFSVTAGLEHVKFDEETNGVTTEAVDHNGAGLNLALDVVDARVNLNAAYKDDNLDNDVDDVLTLGANVIYGPFGVGYIHSREDDSSDSDPHVNSLYAAYTVPFFALENANVTFAATSSYTNSAGGNDELHGGRVRFFYAF
ncbi:carbohydrate porin [Halomonas sp. LBP4]|uniref:carbohydrate porin n=1 Tax=Halomonas sp. LBP4 TaxID=2044917 RepID=UPI000D76E28B|nr:carbohydrate porin [Halomonas sp. LBP4]PXX99942.1 hypothetical protein CR157_04040 [Halomonas sp. LBP4]